MFESKSGVLLIAGLGFFGLAFLSNGLVPILLYADRKEKTAEELVNHHVVAQLQDLATRYPEGFARAFGAPPPYPAPPTADETDEQRRQRLAGYYDRTSWMRDQCAPALREGRRTYIGEGCWHCHSQFVRPVSRENERWGPVSQAEEYENELQRPVLFGTRRVGPDLSREGGRRSNDWHVSHFFRPRMTSPESVMPTYPWFFDNNHPDGPGQPNRRGFALILYIQWLGSWLDSYPDYGLPLSGGATPPGGKP